MSLSEKGLFGLVLPCVLTVSVMLQTVFRLKINITETLHSILVFCSRGRKGFSLFLIIVVFITSLSNCLRLSQIHIFKAPFTWDQMTWHQMTRLSVSPKQTVPWDLHNFLMCRICMCGEDDVQVQQFLPLIITLLPLLYRHNFFTSL